ncbi:MFS transporter [Coleofasciculus sp. F4-SAH-05]|uniref:MFS transporter n=1 Tax=Coleofasciculus sp. F4-SAH-05 TaxID=3069525 RepID=UPI0032F93EA2
MKFRSKFAEKGSISATDKTIPIRLLHPNYPFSTTRFPFFYGWIIAVVCTIGIIMSIPGQTVGVSVFTDHLLQATGVSRLELSNAYLVGTLTSGLLLPMGGVLLDRFGARVIVVGSSLWLGGTLCYLSLCDRIAIFVNSILPLDHSAIALIILGLGFTSLRFSGQGMLTMTSRTTLGKWFDRRRGFVSGTTGVFVSFSFSIAPLILSIWINGFGWRYTWVTMAAIVGIGMGFVGWMFYRDNPEECGLIMDGDATTPATTGDTFGENKIRDFTRSQALRTRIFWAVTLTLSSHALVVTGITFHIVDIGAEAGLSQIQAVSLFLPMAILSTIVGYSMGLSADRVSLKYLFLFMIVFQAIGFTCAANLGIGWLRGLTIVGLGASGGCFSTLSTVALPRFFGRMHLGAISGVQMMSMVCASAIGPSLLAVFKDQLGSYQPGLYTCAILPVITLILTLFSHNPQQ